MQRDDFSKATKDQLGRRVAWHCSNPGCRASTVGPSAASENAFSIGVAAHITAAASNGPRYDNNLSAAQRKHYANGIWLCHNCGTKVDADKSSHTVSELTHWKRTAEEVARREVGRTIRPSRARFADPAADLRHSQKMRREFERKALKPLDSRSTIPPIHPYKNFKVRDLIIHRLGETDYPGADDSEIGISSWFRVGLYDFYFEGILVTHHLQGGVLRPNGQWRIEYGYTPEEPDDGVKITVRPLSMIPFRNIELCKWGGDEYYSFPHLYCHFRNQGTPYAGNKYVQVDGDRYEYELPLDLKLP